MILHKLKCWPEPFQAIRDGQKTYEIRVADRPYAVGDMLQLMEFDPRSLRYTGREIMVRVSYKTEPGTWKLPVDVCVLGIEDEGDREKVKLQRLQAEVSRLRAVEALVNRPNIGDFLESTRLEAAHQRLRWGLEHDESKSTEQWFWVVGYLAGKALAAQKAGDVEKALHHTISTAAVLAHWNERLRLIRVGEVGAGQEAGECGGSTTGVLPDGSSRMPTPPVATQRPHPTGLDSSVRTKPLACWSKNTGFHEDECADPVLCDTRRLDERKPGWREDLPW